MVEPTRPVPIDQAARDRIANDLATTLFVEAGAGTGKTSALVDRIVSLVASGVSVEHIAAITFTDRAATELRDRVRRHLEAMAAGQGAAAEVAARALVDLDGAALCTLHAFAQRILIEHPIEAGLPPAVEVMDEVSSLVDFDERWAGVVETLLGDPRHAFTVLASFELGISLHQLRRMARRFDDNWDLIDARLAFTPDPRLIDVEPLLADLREVIDLRKHCTAEADTMLDRLDRVELFADRLEEADDDPLAVVRILSDRKDVTGRRRSGDKRKWAGSVSIDEVRDQLWAVDDHIDAEVQRLNDEVIDRLVEVVGRGAVEAAEHRRRQGQLGFHDLLVLARRVLTDPAHGLGVRAALADHYRYLLLDEFQDTDPLQIELAALIADPDTVTDDWRHLRPRAGSLFFVGDPKQSIYGFRRADMAVYLDARETFGDDAVHLEQNFRTTEPIIDWVNAVFERLIEHRHRAQPEYTPLVAVRVDGSTGPPVVLLGADDADDNVADDLRAKSSADVAAAVSTALAEGWTVVDESKPAADGGPPVETWRPCQPSDIAILVRSRTPVDALAAALTDVGIPYRIEAGFNPLATDEVRDILATLRAVDDPTDELALAAALRTPLFGCGDDDLFEFASAGGRWNHQDPGSPNLPADHPVLEGIAWMAAMHARRPWEGAADLVEHLVRDRRAMELALCSPRPRDAWRRIRTFLDTARAFGETRGSDLRSFLAWCRLHAADDVRVDEVVPPEPDDNAVRILTMHGAKGLEFPICVLADLGSKRMSAGLAVHFPEGGGIAVALTKKLANAPHRAHADALLDADHLERLRLLYVAATRARDHLVLALHRSTPAKEPDHTVTVTNAEILASASADLDMHVVLEPTVLPLPALLPPDTTPIPDGATWVAELDDARVAGERRRTVSATSLAADGAGPDAEAEVEVERRWHGEAGRHGPAIGRAVHQALEVADLTGDGSADARVAAASEDVDPDAVVAKVAAALVAPSVRAATAAEHWRELYVAVPIDDDVLLEGYLDLAWRSTEDGVDGLTVLDYKTDAFTDESDLDAKVARYRHQGAAYALALGRAAGLPVHRMVFCFVGGPDGTPAVERRIDDLDAAVAEVEALLTAQR
ncbi:MAG: UvrD-helicase domain-containing protein [Acidimicrobiales bacterium]|nr:UvrD-helicase domain-containing protein [Acidimicrobiales bacterium]